jgi:hypothetical protein
VKTITLIVIALALSVVSVPAGAQSPLSGGVILKQEVAVPVVRAELWTDPALTVPWLARARPSLDGLMGYDARPDAEKLMVGYQVALNWQLTPTTGMWVSAAMLREIGAVRLADLWDDLGLGFGLTWGF